MRSLILIPLAGGLTLFLIGAAAPGLFVLSLLGMVLLAGTAAVGLTFVQHGGPRAHY